MEIFPATASWVSQLTVVTAPTEADQMPTGLGDAVIVAMTISSCSPNEDFTGRRTGRSGKILPASGCTELLLFSIEKWETETSAIGQSGAALPGSSVLLRLRRALGVDHEVARNRHRIARLRQQELKHHVRAVQEFQLHGG